MWDAPEAREKLVELRGLVQSTLDHLKLVRAKGTHADRARATGVGIEVLVGLSETFEIDSAIRNRIRTVAERWHNFQGTTDDLDRMFGSVLILLERFELIVRAT